MKLSALQNQQLAMSLPESLINLDWDDDGDYRPTSLPLPTGEDWGIVEPLDATVIESVRRTQECSKALSALGYILEFKIVGEPGELTTEHYAHKDGETRLLYYDQESGYLGLEKPTENVQKE